MHLGNINTQQTYKGGECSNDKGSRTKKGRKKPEAQVIFNVRMKMQFVFVHV